MSNAQNDEQIRFDGQVAIVTGSGRGLGRAYALAFAARGARVVVNGTGASGDGAEQSVVDEIRSAGGEAFAAIGSVANRAFVESLAREAYSRWGRVDILVNNAGIVRDKTFAKTSLEEFQFVLDVHLAGAINCTRAIWAGMREQGYGRIVFIGSSTGLGGNFGQSAYGTAKMALVGLANTLGLEGAARNVHVNCYLPVGSTRMNEDLLKDDAGHFSAENAVPGLLFLASRSAPNRVVLLGGGGSYERAYTTMTRGRQLVENTPEELAARFHEISDREGEFVPEHAMEQVANELRNRAALVENS